MSSEANVRMDEFVSQIVTDPAQPPQTVMVTGYVGESAVDEHTRVYFDRELNRYADVPNDAILHAVAHDAGSTLWVARDAQVKPGRGMSRSARAPFLKGAIMEAYGNAAAEVRTQMESLDEGDFGLDASQLFLCQDDDLVDDIKSLLFLCDDTKTTDPLLCDTQSLVDGCPTYSLVECPPTSTFRGFCVAQKTVDPACRTMDPARCPSIDFNTECVPRFPW